MKEKYFYLNISLSDVMVASLEHDMEANNEKLYGIWLPGKGWLRGKDVFADKDLDKANQVARLIGRGAKVLYVDKSIVDFERQYIEHESRSLWRIFKSFLARKMKSFDNNK